MPYRLSWLVSRPLLRQRLSLHTTPRKVSEAVVAISMPICLLPDAMFPVITQAVDAALKMPERPLSRTVLEEITQSVARSIRIPSDPLSRELLPVTDVSPHPFA